MVAKVAVSHATMIIVKAAMQPPKSSPVAQTKQAATVKALRKVRKKAVAAAVSSAAIAAQIVRSAVMAVSPHGDRVTATYPIVMIPILTHTDSNREMALSLSVS